MELVAQNEAIFDNLGQAVAVVSMMILKYVPEGASFTAFDTVNFEHNHVLNCYVDEETGTATLKVETFTENVVNNIPWK